MKFILNLFKKRKDENKKEKNITDIIMYDIKKIDKLVKKLNKLITKATKKGLCRVSYDYDQFLSPKQWKRIKDYYTERGYIARLDIYGYDVMPTIEISWCREV